MVNFRASMSHLFLYSTATWLSHVIAQEYYGDSHYVWCCPYFDTKSIREPSAAPPPSSCPKEIYLQLAKDVDAGDRHSPKIAQARAGIVAGAVVKKKAGLITDAQFSTITEIVELAESREFKPLLYVMSYRHVRRLLRDVEPREKAHPLSPEYVIEHLPRPCFDIIDFSR